MSTRATYRFADDVGTCLATVSTIYIHYDGYPEGAATYFYATLINASKGGFATQFIRANEHAELTKGHDVHGDTEYQYDVEGSGPGAMVYAYSVDWSDGDRPRKRRPIFSGTVLEFIDAHRKCLGDEYEPFKLVDLRYGSKRWFNLTTARQYIEREYGPLSHLRIWSKSPNPMSRTAANWQSCADELRAVCQAFPQLWTAEIYALTDTGEVTA